MTQNNPDREQRNTADRIWSGWERFILVTGTGEQDGYFGTGLYVLQQGG